MELFLIIMVSVVAIALFMTLILRVTVNNNIADDNWDKLYIENEKKIHQQYIINRKLKTTKVDERYVRTKDRLKTHHIRVMSRVKPSSI